MNTSTFNAFIGRNKGEVVEFLWRVNEQGGLRVVILSSYGDWSDYWCSPGNDPVKFMAGLNRDYVGQNMVEGDYMTNDAEHTGIALAANAILGRREGALTKDEARDEYELAHEMQRGEVGIEGFMSRTIMEDAWEFPEKVPNHSWVCFWKYLWEPTIQPFLLELAAGEAA